jgi:hypothetical protein
MEQMENSSRPILSLSDPCPSVVENLCVFFLSALLSASPRFDFIQTYQGGAKRVRPLPLYPLPAGRSCIAPPCFISSFVNFVIFAVKNSSPGGW